jgi:Na+(H+)/acetate symporter ActP
VNSTSPYATPAIVVVTLVTLAIGAYGLRLARTTSDFLVASRMVPPALNAAAISGEYLSAASFLGVAGLILKNGADMLWYPVGFAAGYLALLLLVAAPLRRSGAFTLPDFCQLRLRSTRLRLLAAAFVVFIGWLYLLPQFQGAGLALRTVTGAPYALGAVIVAAVVTGNVALGGMRAITFVQAFQYWLKLTALIVPMLFLLSHWQAAGRPALAPPDGTVFHVATSVHIDQTTRITVTESTPLTSHGVIDGSTVDGPDTLVPGPHVVGPDTVLTFPAGSHIPEVAGVSDGPSWLLPSDSSPQGLFATYSLILATFLGTMGLPHVLVRFYTNPDGVAARRTTLVVLGLVGLFYLFPTLYGVLGRLYAPQLLLSGSTDAVVLVLPSAALGPGLTGQLLAALVAAGAFAAFLSSASGLLTAVAGVLSTDLIGRGSVRDFRTAAAVAGVVPLALALRTANLDVSLVVGLAFAVAASSFCPLLVLGIWWRGLTSIGAAAGILAGGGAAALAVLLTVLGHTGGGWTAVLLRYPAAWTVPLAFTVMVLASAATRGRVPDDVSRIMLRLHVPESLRP